MVCTWFFYYYYCWWNLMVLDGLGLQWFAHDYISWVPCANVHWRLWFDTRFGEVSCLFTGERYVVWDWDSAKHEISRSTEIEIVSYLYQYVSLISYNIIPHDLVLDAWCAGRFLNRFVLLQLFTRCWQVCSKTASAQTAGGLHWWFVYLRLRQTERRSWLS